MDNTVCSSNYNPSSLPTVPSTVDRMGDIK